VAKPVENNYLLSLLFSNIYFFHLLMSVCLSLSHGFSYKQTNLTRQDYMELFRNPFYEKENMKQFWKTGNLLFLIWHVPGQQKDIVYVLNLELCSIMFSKT